MEKKVKYYYFKSHSSENGNKWYLVKDYEDNFLENANNPYKISVVKIKDFKKAMTYKKEYYDIYSREFPNFKIKTFRKYA